MAALQEPGSIAQLSSPLFVFELANNHMGDLDHGLRIIEECAKVARDFEYNFAFKLQYRQLDTFIHPDFRKRMDIKTIKRFTETRLTREQTGVLVRAIKANRFLAMCTPFDETSVDQIIEDGFDILKIASCSFTDWPLLEKIVETNLPVVGSTGGVGVEDIDRVVSFFSHRRKSLALMTCVAEYPTPLASLELNQIDMLRARYPSLCVGYSTHEDPDETTPIMMAIAKGAQIFEKHVGLTTERLPLNTYSAEPAQLRRWLEAARKAFAISGRHSLRDGPTEPERLALQELRRGVYLKCPVDADQRITDADVHFAIPAQPGQITANDWSKYTHFYARRHLASGSPLMKMEAHCVDVRAKIIGIVEQVKHLLLESKGALPGEAVLELSHHYGIDRFHEIGATMITVVNRSYCKKVIAILPGQSHPPQYHKIKEETFHIIHGTLHLDIDGVERTCCPGDVVTIAPGSVHAFKSDTGAVFEEISSAHLADDSYYCDDVINSNPCRKTLLRYWL